jgi:hypothetical protein
LNQPVKLLLDECLGPPLVEDLAKLLSWDYPAPVIHHLFKYFKPGSADDVWIPQIANEGWIILTGDRGKKSGKVKLPAICVTYKITHILMGSSVLHLKQIERVNAIIAVWSEIKKCGEAPEGSRFTLRLGEKRRPIIKQFILPPNV